MNSDLNGNSNTNSHSQLFAASSPGNMADDGNENTDEHDLGSGVIGLLITMMSWLLVLITFPFSLFFCFKVVQEYERAVIFRLGRLQSGGSRGIFFVLPCIESYTKVDLRTSCFDIPPQEVLTKDSVTVSVDAVVYYRVSNAIVSIANVANAHQSTRLLAQTTLRNILGTKNLHEILSERESISASLQASLDIATEAWGIKVERVEIKDVRLPVQLQRAMAAEAEASREARAKVIAAEGEQKASRALKEASDVISESPAALQLRYLQEEDVKQVQLQFPTGMGSEPFQLSTGMGSEPFQLSTGMGSEGFQIPTGMGLEGFQFPTGMGLEGFQFPAGMGLEGLADNFSDGQMMAFRAFMQIFTTILKIHDSQHNLG